MASLGLAWPRNVHKRALSAIVRLRTGVGLERQGGPHRERAPPRPCCEPRPAPVDTPTSRHIASINKSDVPCPSSCRGSCPPMSG